MPAYFNEGFFVREPAWHGLGQVLADYPDFTLVGTNLPDDPMVLAGHDFEVTEQPVYVKREGFVPEATFPKLPGWKAVTNSKTGAIIAVTNETYTVLQNSLGWDLAEAFVGASSQVKVETAGVLKDGAICWLLLRIDEPWLVPGDDSPIYPFVNVSWAHDGSAAMRAFSTDIRTVCWNTHTAGMLKAEQQNRVFSFRHTKNAKARIDEAKQVLAGVSETSAAFQELAQELVAIPVTDEQREKFVTTFIPRPVGEVISDRVLDNINEARAKVRGIFDSPTIPDAHRNTAYGLVEAGVEYLDWLRGARNKETLFGRQLLREEPLKAKLVPMVRELVSA